MSEFLIQNSFRCPLQINLGVLYIVPIDFPIYILQFSILSKHVFLSKLLSQVFCFASLWAPPHLSPFGWSRPAGRPYFFVFLHPRMFLECFHRSCLLIVLLEEATTNKQIIKERWKQVRRRQLRRRRHRMRQPRRRPCPSYKTSCGRVLESSPSV